METKIEIGIDRAESEDTSCPKGKKVELRRIKTIGICKEGKSL